jgi:steroid delta-isomerase-like uncharacterized protein
MGHLSELVKKGFEAADRGDFDTVVEMTGPDVEFWDLGRPPVQGKAEVRASLERIFRAFPDAKTTIRNLVESGDKVAAEVTFSGTNLGPAHGIGGEEIPPTGKRISIEVCHMIRFDGEKLASYRVYGDMLGVLMQLGLIPNPAAAG